jgi:hypothetical protein
MPLNRAQCSRKSIEQEGRILLAIKDIQNSSTESIYQIAERFSGATLNSSAPPWWTAISR